MDVTLIKPGDSVLIPNHPATIDPSTPVVVRAVYDDGIEAARPGWPWFYFPALTVVVEES